MPGIARGGHPRGYRPWFTKIEDHIDSLIIRIDPDKVTPYFTISHCP
jgi:hypothetical protein